MSDTPVSARPGNTLADIEAMMDMSQIRHLPVVDQDGCVIGIVSHRDLRRAGGRGRAAAHAADLMVQDVLMVRPENRACEATALMLEHKIGALPVVDERDVLVGIITETDFLRIAHQVCGGDELSVDDD